MSDGGFDVDEFKRKSLDRTNLFGIRTDPITGLRVSFPSVPNSPNPRMKKRDPPKPTNRAQNKPKNNSDKTKASNQTRVKNNSAELKRPKQKQVKSNNTEPRAFNQEKIKTVLSNSTYKVKCRKCTCFNKCNLKYGFEDICPYN